MERVVRGLQVVHEAYFEVGDHFPELVGYEAGPVWVPGTCAVVTRNLSVTFSTSRINRR